MEDINEILAYCLDEIEVGRMSVADCLTAYPDVADELASLLAVSGLVREVSAEITPIATPSPTFQAKARQRLLTQLPTPQSSNWLNTLLAYLRPPQRPRLRYALPLLLLIFFFSTTTTIFAATNSIPGNRLYAVKTRIEDYRLERADSDSERVTLRLAFADERLEEIDALVKRERVQHITPAGEAYADQIHTATQIVHDNPTDALTNQLTESLDVQAPRLDELAQLIEALPIEGGKPSLKVAQVALASGQTYLTTGILVAADATILDVLLADERFSRFVAAIEQSGATAFFAGAGMRTALIPTNAAVDALPQWEAIVADEQRLQALVNYHLADGEVSAENLATLSELTTKQGQSIRIVGSADTPQLNESAAITTPNITTANGTLHIIDAVLLPPQTLWEEVASRPELSLFAQAIETAGLNWQLNDNGPFTLFAPTNAAFDQLPTGSWDAIAADALILRQTLLYHYVQGVVSAETLNGTHKTALGIDLIISTQLLNDGSQLVSADIPASNGILHLIDTPLIPSEYP